MVFADGRVIWGRGFGAEGEAVGELCFNTAMTGYQEVMTDPSYAKQVIAFTFPAHRQCRRQRRGCRSGRRACAGLPRARDVDRAQAIIVRAKAFADWMGKWGRIGIAGVDTRALTRLVREEGPPTIAVAHRADGAVRSRGAAAAGGGLAWARGDGSGQGGQPAAGRALD